MRSGLSFAAAVVVLSAAAPVFAQDYTRGKHGEPVFEPEVDPSVVDHDLAGRLDAIRRQYADDPEAQRVLGPLANFYRTGDSRFETEFEFANVGYGTRKARELARTMPPSPRRPEDVPRFLRQMDAYSAWKHRPLRQKIVERVKSVLGRGR